MNRKEKLPTVFCEEKDYYTHEWHDYYNSIIKLVPDNTSVLDIGCGRGGLLAYLRKEKNCSVTGLDISEDAVNACRSKQIDTIKCDVEADEIPGIYDVIILSAVLEHIIDPPSILTKLRSNLTDSGHLIIGVPNFSDISSRIRYLLGMNVKRFGDLEVDNKLGIQPPDHIQFFNRATLSHLLECTGYKPLEWSYFISTLDISTKSSPVQVIKWVCYKFHYLNPPLFSVFLSVCAKPID